MSLSNNTLWILYIHIGHIKSTLSRRTYHLSGTSVIKQHIKQNIVMTEINLPLLKYKKNFHQEHQNHLYK